MNHNPTSPDDLERDMPECENPDPEWEAQKFGMTKEEYQKYEQRSAKKSLPLMMGKDYERYFNDEGEDILDLAAKAERMREAEWERKIEQWNEKHGHDVH